MSDERYYCPHCYAVIGDSQECRKCGREVTGALSDSQVAQERETQFRRYNDWCAINAAVNSAAAFRGVEAS